MRSSRKLSSSQSASKDVFKWYQDVMPEDLPNELPPRRKVDHKIEVKPGPNCHKKNTILS